MSHLIVLRHTFEAAHRLPHLGGKCSNLHGHSWAVDVTIGAAALTPAHTLVEFSAFKTAMRSWIDANLDHGAMLGADDPLTYDLLAHDCKVFVFGRDENGARWPTVEGVAQTIGEASQEWLSSADDVAPGARIMTVRVVETANNAAAWVPPEPEAR